MSSITTKKSFAMILSLSLLWHSTSNAAPLCRQVLRAHSAEQINATLDKLAELRMELDLEKAQGPLKATHKKLEKDFQEKQNETLSSLHIDRASLQTMLQNRIHILQSKNVFAEKEKQEQRVSEASKIKSKPPTYTLQKELPGFGGGSWTILDYSENTNSILLHNYQSRQIGSMDLATKKVTIMGDDAQGAHVSGDRQKLLTSNMWGEIKVYTLDGMKELRSIQLDIQSVPTNGKGTLGQVAITSNGNQLAGVIDKNLYLFDTTTGALLKSLGEIDDISPLRFRRDDELYFNRNKQLTKVDISTGHEVSVSFKGDIYSVNAQKEYMIGSKGDGSLLSISGNDLTAIDSGQTINSGNPVLEIPGKPDLVAIFGAPISKSVGVSGIYDRIDLTKPLFDFGKTYLTFDKNVSQVFFADDQKTVLVLYYGHLQHDNKAIDIWTLDSP
jgi:hypothetical protein